MVTPPPDAPKHPTRRTVFQTVRQHAGAHASRVGKEAGLPVSTARYHLERLVGQGRLEVEAFGQYRAFYPPSIEDPDVRRLLHHLNRDIAGAIVRMLATHGPLRRPAIARKVSRSVSTVSHHLRTLREEGVVRQKTDSSTRYALATPDEVRSVLRRHPALWRPCCDEHVHPP